MTFVPETERKQLRLAGYDYKKAGLYYVTLCTYGRLCLFGKISNEKMLLNDAGRMLHETWTNLPKHFTNVYLDSFIIMPNHLHAIVILSESLSRLRKFVTAQRPSPTNCSLSSIIKSFKTYTTRQYIENIRQHGWPAFKKKLWQRSFYEHIIRNDTNLLNIQQYIADNPLKWDLDRENPSNIKAKNMEFMK